MLGLRLKLFGPPRLEGDGELVRLRSRKCLALLSYLAVTPRAHRRDSLASLLWPESDARRAHNSLRNTLYHLRRALKGEWLLIDRETLVLDGSKSEAVDVVRFRDLLARCRAHDHGMMEVCSQCLQLLEEAVELYQGDFMEGFTLSDTREFDAWQVVEGEALRRELLSTLEQLVDGYAAEGAVEEATAHAQRWAALDPMDEAAHRALMRLYSGSGRQPAALRQFATCKSILEREMGVSPSGETQDLYEAIRRGRMPQPLARAAIRAKAQATAGNNLPVQPTRFVGRDRELDEIAERLSDPDCRLLTVLGQGGMGKTRVAIQAGEEHLSAFRDGVWFVPLASVQSVELLPAVIMEVLSAPRYGGSDPRVQLTNYLRGRNLLLVLDNLEHLLECAPLLTDLLANAPGIKLLVTSRQRLNLQQEWLLPLRGLHYPPDMQASSANEEEHSAMELFMRCARRVQPGSSSSWMQPAFVGRICRLVEGMPLAIELAASWTRVMGCEEIAREIEGGLDLLATTLRDVPQRHRSMNTVFDHSWKLLTSEEQMVLGGLWVFRGGFRREAAEAVALPPGTPSDSARILLSLLDKSWLRRSSPDRYEMHELVRQYCVTQLESEAGGGKGRESDRVRHRHACYYGSFLRQREPHLHGKRQVGALRQTAEDIDNVRAAWRWAVAEGDVNTIGKCVESLALVGRIRAWNHELRQTLEEAAAAFRGRLDATHDQAGGPEREEITTLLAQVLAKQASFSRALGRAGEAISLCEESLALLRGVERDARRDSVQIEATLELGSMVLRVGDVDQGRRLHQEALELAEKTGDPWYRELALFDLATDARHEGRWDKAEQLLQEAITIAEESGEEWWRASCLDSMSAVLWYKGEYDGARILAEDSLWIRERFADRSTVSYSLVRLAQVAVATGDYNLASEYCRRALAVIDEIGNPEMRGECLLIGSAALASATGRHDDAKELILEVISIVRRSGYTEVWQCINFAELGNTCLALGELADAREYLLRGLRGASEGGSRFVALNTLVGLAQLSAREGDLERAAGLAALGLHHPSSDQATRDRAEALLAGLEEVLPREVFVGATTRGSGRELEEVAAEMLDGQAGPR